MKLAEKLRKIAHQHRADGDLEKIEIQNIMARAAKKAQKHIVYDYIVTQRTAQWLHDEGFIFSYDYNKEQTTISW